MDVEVAAKRDRDLLERAGYEANLRASPYPRVSSLQLDVLTMDDALTLAVVALDVGDTITAKTWPTQAVTQALDLTLEGWTETISLTRWVIDVNTSPSVGLPSSAVAAESVQSVFVLNNPIAGLLDAGLITGY